MGEKKKFTFYFQHLSCDCELFIDANRTFFILNMNFIRTYTRYAVVLSSITGGVSKTKVSVEETEDSALAYIDSQLMTIEEYTNLLDGKHDAVKKRRLQYEEKMVNIGHFEVDEDGQMRRLTADNSPLDGDLKAIKIELDALITEEQLFENMIGYFNDESDALKDSRTLMSVTDEQLMKEVERRRLITVVDKTIGKALAKHGPVAKAARTAFDPEPVLRDSINIPDVGAFGGGIGGGFGGSAKKTIMETPCPPLGKCPNGKPCPPSGKCL